MIQHGNPWQTPYGAVRRRGATQTVVHPIARIVISDACNGCPSSMCCLRHAASSDAQWRRSCAVYIQNLVHESIVRRGAV